MTPEGLIVISIFVLGFLVDMDIKRRKKLTEVVIFHKYKLEWVLNQITYLKENKKLFWKTRSRVYFTLNRLYEREKTKREIKAFCKFRQNIFKYSNIVVY